MRTCPPGGSRRSSVGRGYAPGWCCSSIFRRHPDEPLSGNHSLAWAEDGLLVHKFIWQSAIGTTVLYSAFLVHFALGLFALYERRMLHWTGSELAQLLLGLAVPPLLANHLAGTRIAYAAYGIDRGYAQVLYSLWVASPYSGILQTALLIVA